MPGLSYGNFPYVNLPSQTPWNARCIATGLMGVLDDRRRGRVARCDQIDISDPKRPRLTCLVEELQTTRG